MTDESLTKDESLRFQLLRILEDRPGCTQRELADALGISLGRANYCLKALAAKGLMKVENFRASNNKWRYAYVLTPSGIKERAVLTGRFLALKLREFEALKAEIAMLQGGDRTEAVSGRVMHAGD